MLKKIIIVGATSGIGREMALLYLKQGCMVGITGRRSQLLQELKMAYPQQVFTSCFDVMEPGNLKNLGLLIEHLGGLDLFIYNSGFGDVSEQLDGEIEIITTKTNVNGFVEMAPFVFNYFVQQGGGHIAVTSSIAALRGNSLAPAYSASKAFISNYAEGLNIKANRLKKNIVVTDVQPGFISTKLSKGNKRFWVAPPDKAARQIVKAIDQKKRKVYITKRWWLVAKLLPVIPYFIYKRLG
jgi:short-subunit dehydrogenase